MDASTFFNSPRHSDVVIVLKEDEDASQDGPRPKRQRLESDADVAQQNVELEQQPAGEQQQGEQQQCRTLRLHGHNVLLSASSSVIRAPIDNWSEGDGNELVLHVSQVRTLFLALP
jgi:hypothetical protein